MDKYEESEKQVQRLQQFEEDSWNLAAQHLVWDGPQIQQALGNWSEGIGFVLGYQNFGKCHAKGTKVRMFDGTVKKVEDVVVGDQLMGPNSQPRNVLKLGKGRDMLYQVNEYSSQYGVSSESYKINSHHILSLSKKTTSIYKKHTIVNINVKDYLALPDTEKAKLFGWRSGVDYPEKPLEVSPYDIGTYQSYCNNYYRMSSKKRTHINTLLKDVEFELKSKSLLDIKNSKIPFSYKINSRQNRLELLAGILDGAGYKSGRKILITFKSEDYGKDVLDLGRSLNLVVDVNKVFDLYTLCFKGNLSEIPCKFINTESFVSKNNEVVQYSISVAEVGEGEYYGFELDGDHLYLLENYTVTHNTSWLLSRVTALIKNNPDLVVLDFSLDDSFEERCRRYLSILSGVTTEKIGRPVMCTTTDLEKRKAAYSRLESFIASGQLHIKTEEEDGCSYLATIIKIIEEFSASNVGKKILVIIDAWHDIIMPESKSEDIEKSALVELKSCLKRHKAICLMTAHRRKSSVGNKTSSDELKGSAYLKYAAKIILNIDNDLKENGENALIYWTDERDLTIKNPVMEVFVQKNKTSAYTGNFYYYFVPENGKSQEVTSEADKQYRAIQMAAKKGSK